MGASCELDSLTFSRSVSVGVINEVKFSFSLKKKKKVEGSLVGNIAKLKATSNYLHV